MKWNELNYWVRGVILGAAAFVVLNLFTYLVGYISGSQRIIGFINVNILANLVSLLIFAIIGGIIGFVLDKLNN